MAAYYGYKEIVELLSRQKGCDINMKDIFKSITFMIFKSNFFHEIKITNDLWNLSRILNKTALIHAAYRGHKETVELLLSQEGIDINIKDIFKSTTFMIFKSNFKITLKYIMIYGI